MKNLFYLFYSFVVISASHTLNDTIYSVWNGIKQFNINHYDIPLIHRPHSEIPGDAVSEGIGYGMIVACYLNDQEYFDKIWTEGERHMWNGKWYDWRTDEFGRIIANGAATDAEQDIAFALICGDQKIKNGEWLENTTKIDYKTRALNIIENMWAYQMIIQDTFEVAPGAGWGGREFVNVGYFAPAWYRIFAKYDTKHEWYKVIDRCYEILEKSPGYVKGLVPDWMTPHGEFLIDDGLGYNSYGGGQYLYKDAIRVYWRIGTDLLWNPSESRAKTFLKNAFHFIENRQPNFFDMNGNLIPENDIWRFHQNQMSRHRREYSALTVGMWSIVPKVFKNDNRFEKDLMQFHQNSSQLYFGGEQEENELYFEQFMGLFGAFILNNQFHSPI